MELSQSVMSGPMDHDSHYNAPVVSEQKSAPERASSVSVYSLSAGRAIKKEKIEQESALGGFVSASLLMAHGAISEENAAKIPAFSSREVTAFLVQHKGGKPPSAVQKKEDKSVKALPEEQIDPPIPKIFTLKERMRIARQKVESVYRPRSKSVGEQSSLASMVAGNPSPITIVDKISPPPVEDVKLFNYTDVKALIEQAKVGEENDLACWSDMGDVAQCLMNNVRAARTTEVTFAGTRIVVDLGSRSLEAKLHKIGEKILQAAYNAGMRSADRESVIQGMERKVSPEELKGKMKAITCARKKDKASVEKAFGKLQKMNADFVRRNKTYCSLISSMNRLAEYLETRMADVLGSARDCEKCSKIIEAVEIHADHLFTAINSKDRRGYKKVLCNYYALLLSASWGETQNTYKKMFRKIAQKARSDLRF